jgi:hypothetical protein
MKTPEDEAFEEIERIQRIRTSWVSVKKPQDEIIRLAVQCQLSNGSNSEGIYFQALQSFAKLVEEKERKTCAELCMDLHTLTDGAHNFYHFAANQILKRGQA